MQAANGDNKYKLTIDGAILRPTRPARTITADHNNWTMAGSSNCFVLPELGVAMLLPVQFSKAWQQVGSGSSRTRLSDWNVPNANFAEWPLRHAEDYYIDGTCDGNIVSTKSDYGTNQAWWASLYINSAGNDARCAIILAYNGLTGTWPNIVAANIAVGIYTDGTCKVWLGANEIGSGSIAAQEKGKAKGASGGQDQANTSTQNIAGRYVDVFILPQGRSLIVTSSLGGVCSVGIPGLDDDDANPTLTAGGTFVFYAPSLPDGSAQRITAQVCPIKYATTGTVKAYPQYTGDITALPTWLRVIYGRTRLGDGTSATPSITNDDQLTTLNVAMSGNGAVTPFVYGAVATWCFDGDYETSSPIEVDAITSHFEDGPRSDDGKAQFSTRLTGPLGDADTWQQAKTGNRSWRLDVNDVCWMAGVCSKPPEATVSYGSVDTPWEGDDVWGMIKATRLRDALPLDGLTLSAAVLMLLSCAGIQPEVCDMPTFNYTLPIGDKGEWMVLAEAGSSVGEMIDKLHDDYAKDHWFGFRPGVTITGQTVPQYAFWWRAPEALDNTVRATVCLRSGTEFEPAVEYRQHLVPPLANEIWVTGRDPALRKRIQAYWIDRNSQLVNGAKTPEWLGMPVLAGVANDSWCTQTEVNRVCTMLAKAWGKAKIVAEIITAHPLTYGVVVNAESDPVSYKVPVWSGDRIKLIGYDGDTGVLARVRTVSLTPSLIKPDVMQIKCSYTLEIEEVAT